MNPINKKKDKKKSNKYLSAKPKIEMLYNVPTKISSGYTLIKNGNKLAAPKIKKIPHYYVSTCKFDAITEIFIRAYHNFNQFHEFCNKEKNHIFFWTL